MGAAVRIVAPGYDLTLPLGADAPSITGGWTTIEDVERTDDRPVSSWKGGSLWRIDVPVLLDGLADDLDQGPTLEIVKALAHTTNSPPVPFAATGPLPVHADSWVIEGVDWGRTDRNAAGLIVRQVLTLKLCEWNPAAALVVTTAGGSAPGAAKGATKTYTVKAGDTLTSIAARVLGNAKFAGKIGDLNNIRDVRKPLTAGRVLRLPIVGALAYGLDYHELSAVG